MGKTLHFQRPNNLAKLADELWASGLIPTLIDGVPTVTGKDSDIFLAVSNDADETAIAALVAAHDPTGPQPLPSLEERLAALEAAMLEQILGGA